MDENMAGKKKEAKSDEEFSRSNWLPACFGRLPPDNGDSSLGHHAHTPVDSTLAEDESELKVKLHSLAGIDEWHGAKSIFDKHPKMVRTPLTANGDRVLHIAVRANSINFVQQLVNGRYMTLEDLEIQDEDGSTAFCVAAISGNATLIQIMMAKNDNLPGISGKDGMLPVHLAASSGHHEIVQLLASNNLLLEMKYNDIERLFLMTISSDIFDVAIKLFERYRNLLARAKTDENLRALHILARKPSEFSCRHSPGMKLFKEMWTTDKMLGLVDKHSTVLFEAIHAGNDGAARCILTENPELLTLKDEAHGRSPLHYAVLYRRESVLRYILERKTVNLIIGAVDSERNNVLHLAASYQSHKALSRLDAEIKRELAWFKEVEESVPPDLRRMKNSKGQTPKDVFYANHRELCKEVKETVKGIGNSAMLVATLIATVAFAAALTVPGDDKTSAWFVVFFLTNTVALFASSASIISFLSIFTLPWFIKDEFIISPTLINLGLVLLVVSVVTMVLSFAAASFLIFGHVFKWAAYVVVSMGVLPISLLVLQSKYAIVYLTTSPGLELVVM